MRWPTKKASNDKMYRYMRNPAKEPPRHILGESQENAKILSRDNEKGERWGLEDEHGWQTLDLSHL